MPYHCMVKLTYHTSSYLMGGSQSSMEVDGKLSEATLSPEGAIGMLSKRAMEEIAGNGFLKSARVGVEVGGA